MGDLTTLANVKGWLGLTGLAVSTISNASPAVFTLQTRPATPLVSGMSYSIEGAQGMAFPAGTYQITVTSPITFTVPVNTTSLGAYTGGAVIGISDPLLSRMIAACSTFIESWLNRIIAAQEYTEMLNGNDRDTLFLENYPVTAINSLKIDGHIIAQRGELPSSGGYVFDNNELYLDGGYFTKGIKNVKVVYTAGYSSIPADIEQACIDMIGDWFRYIDRIGKTSQAIEGQSTSFTNTAIPARALLVLQQYKRVVPI